MARRSSRKRKKRMQTRDVNTISIQNSWMRSAKKYRYTNLKNIEDRRTFHPDGLQRPARSFNRSLHRLTIPKFKKVFNRNTRTYKMPSAHIMFENPKKVLTCVRRKIRKEVLFAKRKTGRSGQKRPRWTEYSKIRCK